jgi:hypothetical protein
VSCTEYSKFIIITIIIIIAVPVDMIHHVSVPLPPLLLLRWSSLSHRPRFCTTRPFGCDD